MAEGSSRVSNVLQRLRELGASFSSSSSESRVSPPPANTEDASTSKKAGRECAKKTQSPNGPTDEIVNDPASGVTTPNPVAVDEPLLPEETKSCFQDSWVQKHPRYSIMIIVSFVWIVACCILMSHHFEIIIIVLVALSLPVSLATISLLVYIYMGIVNRLVDHIKQVSDHEDEESNSPPQRRAYQMRPPSRTTFSEDVVGNDDSSQPVVSDEGSLSLSQSQGTSKDYQASPSFPTESSPDVTHSFPTESLADVVTHSFPTETSADVVTHSFPTESSADVPSSGSISVQPEQTSIEAVSKPEVGKDPSSPSRSADSSSCCGEKV